ncbi:MAG: hypothetical protein AAGI48_03380 [Verrucomicrobiota bacterium]
MKPARPAVLVPLFFTAILSNSSPAAPVEIPLTGSGASETNGNGHAFVVPNIKGNPAGGFIPLDYPPIPFDPAAPTPPGPAEIFNFGSLTYDDAGIPASGSFVLPVTPSMFDFDFKVYSEAFAIEVGTDLSFNPDTVVTLENITGPGLTFEDGTPVRLDFTADVTWQPMVEGFNNTIDPYTGNLSVVNGTFTFDLSDDPETWVFPVFVSDVEFEFDLIATVDSLEQVIVPALPKVVIAADSPTQASIFITFPPESSGTFQLESSLDLSNGPWDLVGGSFTPETVTSPVTVPIDGAAFYRVRQINP